MSWQGVMAFSVTPDIVPSSKDPRQRRQLHPLPRGVVELYGLIAVLIVLIPEWLAEGTMSLNPDAAGNQLPMTARAWQSLPELRMASMSLAELRQLAREMRLWGYGGDCREALTARLLKKMRKRWPQQRQERLTEEQDAL
ncbi:MAG: hypothetical protein AB8E87_11055 [Prochlorococcus sp.]